MITIEAGLPASGAFAFLEKKIIILKKRKVQHVAKISSKEGELMEIRRDFYLEKLINTGKAYSDRLY